MWLKFIWRFTADASLLVLIIGAALIFVRAAASFWRRHHQEHGAAARRRRERAFVARLNADPHDQRRSGGHAA